MLLRTLLASAIASWLLFQCSHAQADPAAAEALFREGRALLERGELAAACEKLAESNALEPSAGTLLNLATCHSKQGKTATSWANFLSAERLAEQQNRPEQALEAKRRAAELEPRLCTLTLRAAETLPGLELRRAGQVVHAASFGTAVPVDPGPMLIEVSAPGYQPARLELTIGTSADHRVLEIPRLRKLEEPEGASLLPPRDSQDSVGTAVHTDTSAVLPWTIGVVGGATLVAGGVLGALALSSNSKAVEACGQTNNAAECTATQARRDNQALASTVGVVGIGVAAIWLLTGHAGRPRAAWSYQAEVTRESALMQMRLGF